MKKSIFIFALCALTMAAWAEDFWEDQNCYEIIDADAKTVRLINSWKDGELNIPAQVTCNDDGKDYKGTEFTVTEIGNGGWVMVSERVANLTTLTIPATITKVAAWAFASCDNLTTIYSKPAVAPAIGGDAFKGSDTKGWDFIFKNCKIYVPSEVAKATYNTAEWSYWQCFYNEGNVIVETTTAFDNTAIETKSVKIIRNGQVLILKDGKTYNALGVEVK